MKVCFLLLLLVMGILNHIYAQKVNINELVKSVYRSGSMRDSKDTLLYLKDCNRDLFLVKADSNIQVFDFRDSLNAFMKPGKSYHLLKVSILEIGSSQIKLFVGLYEIDQTVKVSCENFYYFFDERIVKATLIGKKWSKFSIIKIFDHL